MWINMISWIGIIISFLAIKYYIDKPYFPKVLRALSLILLVYKTGQYTYLSITDGFTYPVEISTITYFVFSIIIVFNIKGLFHMASFFGILSGLGYYIYYAILGYMSTFHLGTYDLIIALISHGIIFVGGVYLLTHYYFANKKILELLIAVILILIHAAIYYADKDSGTTFIYRLVKLDYLNLTASLFVNVIIKIIFYLLWTTFFLSVAKAFYDLNHKLHKDTNQIAP